MRNYIKELKDRGYTYKSISKETGLPVARLSALVSGKSNLRSNTKIYEKIRNVSRRTAYQELIEAGTPSKEASGSRRTIFYQKDVLRPDRVRRIKKVKFKDRVYQLTVLAEYSDPETNQKQLVYGHSTAYKKKNYKVQSEEALKAALDELGLGYDIMGDIHIVESFYTKFILGQA